jgi:putative FmdB family regulatory protein
MPIYCYQCRCGHSFEQVRPMSESGKAMRCPECKRSAPRDIGAENRRHRTPKDACWPLRSEALGCQPDQVPALQKELKEHGLPGKVYSDGTVEVSSRKEYMQHVRAYHLDSVPCGRLSPKPRRRHVSR